MVGWSRRGRGKVLEEARRLAKANGGTKRSNEEAARRLEASIRNVGNAGVGERGIQRMGKLPGKAFERGSLLSTGCSRGGGTVEGRRFTGDIKGVDERGKRVSQSKQASTEPVVVPVEWDC